MVDTYHGTHPEANSSTHLRVDDVRNRVLHHITGGSGLTTKQAGCAVGYYVQSLVMLGTISDAFDNCKYKYVSAVPYTVKSSSSAEPAAAPAAASTVRLFTIFLFDC